VSASALIVGEAPSRTSELPLDGRSGRRLERLAGIGEGELSAWFALGNLLPAWLGNRERRPGPHSAPGDLFDAAQAREAWRSLLEAEFLEFDYVLLLGGRVRAVAGLSNLPWFRWAPYYAGDVPPHFGAWSEEPALRGGELEPAFELSAIPHPSGASHFWNDPANHARAERFMRRLVERLA
jgi:uracil-DNA glycosylase